MTAEDTIVVWSKGGMVIYTNGDPKSQKKRRGRKKANCDGVIVYQIFDDAIKFIDDDPYWVKILQEASQGYFQKMFRYNNGILSYKIKNKIFTQEISQTDPELCLKNFQNVLRHNGFYSNKDHIIKTQEIENLKREALKIDLDWSKIKSKSEKKLLIYNYIVYLRKHYTLTKIEFSSLVNLIKMAYSSGIITCDTVCIEDNRIKDITFLCFDPVSRVFSICENTVFPKLTSTTFKKLRETVTDNDKTSHINIRGGNSKLSKSRSADWAKFAEVMGKRIAVHNKLDNFNEKNKTCSLEDTSSKYITSSYYSDSNTDDFRSSKRTKFHENSNS